MKRYNKITTNSYTTSIQFEEYNIELYEIDEIFRSTNKEFAQYLKSIGIVVTFDFSKKDNKKLYTHYFIKALCEFIKNRQTNLKICFFNNQLTKDPFRNKLIQKVKSIFKFPIWDDLKTIDQLVENIENEVCNDIAGLEIMFEQIISRKPRNFKDIRKYLDKEGLTQLNNTYFQEILNKMIICC